MAYTVRELKAAIAHLPDGAGVVVEASGIPLQGPLSISACGAGVKAGSDGADVAVVRVDIGGQIGGFLGSLGRRP